MKKISRSTKATFITLSAFLFAILAIYFYSDQPTTKTDNPERHTEAQRTEEEEAQKILGQEQDIAAEIWAKEEFVRHEMTHGMDEDDEENEDEELDKKEFVHDEITRGEDEEEEELYDDTPLTEEKIPSKEKEGQLAVQHEEEILAPTQEEGRDKETLPKDASPPQNKASANDKKVMKDSDSKTVPVEQRPTEYPTPLPTQTSPFSTKAQVLPVIISNEPQIEGEFDPYEDIVRPDKIAIPTEEEPVQAHPTEATTQNTTSKEAVAAQAEKETEKVREQESRSKAYIEVTYTVSYLMTKFLQKADYIKELNAIDQTKKLPPEVKQVLAEMKDFAENDMKIPEGGNARIFPKEGVLDSIAGHFVQIEKVTNSKHKNEKYEQIRKKLYILEDYFYSQKFLKEMMENE